MRSAPRLRLECLTKPLDEVPADESTSQVEERQMNICPTFIADSEPSEPIPPSMSSLNHPAMSSKPILGLNPSAGNPRLNTTFSTSATTARIVVPLVSVQLVWAESRPPAGTGNGWHTVQQFFQDLGVVNVGRGQQQGQRNALAINEKMVFRARFALIRRVGTGFFAPFFAVIEAESTAARLQSISPALPSFSRKRRWRRSHTPAACHSWSRRQHVMPLPQPISLGSISQGIPLRRTRGCLSVLLDLVHADARLSALASPAVTEGLPAFIGRHREEGACCAIE